MMKNPEKFDADDFLNSIIAEIGMQNENEEKLKELKNGMLQQMNEIILNTISINIEGEVIDAVTQEYYDVQDPVFLLSLLIENSPMVQIEVIKELEKFKERTIYAFNRLTKSAK